MKKIVNIRGKYNIKDSVVHLAASVVDRYLIKCSISVKDYYKLGIVALWISDKVLNKKPWTVKRWVKLLP